MRGYRWWCCGERPDSGCASGRPVTVAAEWPAPTTEAYRVRGLDGRRHRRVGRALCRRLVAGGGTVIGTGASVVEVDAVRADPTLVAVDWRVLDVASGHAVRQLFAGLVRLDVLVNLAGIGRGVGEFDEQGFIHTVDVNLFGTMRACYAARPLLADQGGAIVNTASMGTSDLRTARGAGDR